MLKHQFRLPANQRMSQPTVFVNNNFLCKSSTTELLTPRFGFVISKKVDKRATVRNRSKRVLRSIIEDTLPLLAGGKDLLFIIKKPIVHRTSELESDVQNILLKTRLLSSENRL